MNIATVIRQFRSITLLSSQSALEFGNALKLRSPACVLNICDRRGKADDRRELIKSTPLKDMGTQGEKLLDVDLINVSQDNVYPDADTPNLLFGGVKFSDLPICHIKASKNNTLLHLSNSAGDFMLYRSCGWDGFKNTRKGTNIAAQTTAVTFAGKALQMGVTNVRVMVQGLGPGRMSAVKGLQMTGLKVVSITDKTPISFNPPRPRKARRL